MILRCSNLIAQNTNDHNQDEVFNTTTRAITIGQIAKFDTVVVKGKQPGTAGERLRRPDRAAGLAECA